MAAEDGAADRWPPTGGHGRAHRAGGRTAAGPAPRTRSRCRTADGAVAASGRARTTRSALAGRRCSSSRTTARSRRVTRWRTTELPTALPTTKPARAPGRRAACAGPDGQVVENHGRPTGAPTGPDDRGELRTPAQACLRGQHLRRRASRDPCAGDRRGSPGPRGCASAAGSRGSWTAGGCSAGTCACSRGTPTTRHRRCAPIGGRARGGNRRERLDGRGPGTPGSCFLRAGMRTGTPRRAGRTGGTGRGLRPA